MTLLECSLAFLDCSNWIDFNSFPPSLSSLVLTHEYVRMYSQYHPSVMNQVDEGCDPAHAYLGVSCIEVTLGSFGVDVPGIAVEYTRKRKRLYQRRPT